MGRQPVSGYCQTCRRRRVKCDRARPTCQRCLSSGHQCGGYDLPLRMHMLGIRSEEDGTQRLAKLPVPVVAGAGSIGRSIGRSIGSRIAQHPPQELSLIAFQQEMNLSCFFGTFAWAPFWRSPLQAATGHDYYPTGNANRICFQAIMYGYAGLKHEDTALAAEGHRLYGQTLRTTQLSLMVPRPAKPLLASLAVTTVLMGMYEFAMHNIMGKAPPHHVGISQILQYCGPATFEQEGLLKVYRACRALLICQSLCRQRRCFLEAESWKTVPWQSMPSRSFEDRVMDIFVHLPGIAEDIVVPEKRAACLVRVASLSTALQAWRWDWHGVHSTSASRVPLDVVGENDICIPTFLREVRKTRLNFNSPTRALEILYYNAALLYLMRLESIALANRSAPAALSSDDELYIRRCEAASTGLLLPDKVKYRCQPAMEVLMALPCIIELLATATELEETVVTPSSLGIVYWSLREQPELAGCLEQVLNKYPVFNEATRVFAGYTIDLEGGGED